MEADEAMFRTNALLTINGHSPYTAVSGRVPHLLPDLNVLPDEDALDSKSGTTLRQVHRIREIAINAIMMETAKLRISRALIAKTAVAGQRLELNQGDRADYHRDDGPKDKSKWIGPCTVIDTNNIEWGSITIRHLQRPVIARIRDVRQHLEFFVFLAASYSAYGTTTSAW